MHKKMRLSLASWLRKKKQENEKGKKSEKRLKRERVDWVAAS